VTGLPPSPEPAFRAELEIPGDANGAASPTQLSFELEPSPLPFGYFFRLAKPAAAVNHNSHGSPDFANGPPDPKKEACKQQTAERLLAADPHLRRAAFPYDQIAHFEKISPDDARRKYRHIELNGPEEGGVQIILRDDDASVTIPFWHEAERVAGSFRELWRYLEIICREAGYIIYDPQAGRSFEPSAGSAEVLACYHQTARQVRESLPVSGPGTPAECLRMPSPPSALAEAQHLLEIRALDARGACGAVLVALRAGTPAGFVEVVIRQDHVFGASAYPIACLVAWYVEPAFRGCGIGPRLLEAAEHWAAARGLRELASTVELGDDEATQTHGVCGFLEAGRTIHFIKQLSPAASKAEAA